MNNVNKTLYIPLYGKAYVSKKGIILEDKKAEEIWAAEAFDLKGKSKSKWLAYYMGMRSAVFDDWLKHKMAQMQQAVVIHIGCGMDSRVLRVGAGDHMWYDVDFAEVIYERKRYYTESANYRMIPGDARDSGWLTDIPETECAIIVMEGVSMYLTPSELKSLTVSLCSHFDQVSLLMDCYTVFAAKMSKYKNPINDVGVTAVYGLDHPALMENSRFSFIQEHSMTPETLVNALHGYEGYIFRRLYAGKMAKKLYRLYEYKSV